MDSHRHEVTLINLVNGYHGNITVHDDPDIKAMSYIEHSDLWSWAEKAGCKSWVSDTWDGKVLDSFLGFEDDDCDAGVMIYQNKERKEYVRSNEKPAFEATRVTGINNRFGDHPNKIIRRNKQ